MKSVHRVVSLLLLLAVCGAAEAHPLHAGAALRDGFLHPWLGWDHLLAMLAVGMWARQRQTGEAVWRFPAAFVAAVAAGAGAGHWIGNVTLIESLIAASLIGLGSLLAVRARLSRLLALAVLLTMGAAHGWAHGVELPEAAPMLPFASGFLAATALLHGVGVAVAAGVLTRGATAALRLGGVGIAVAGCGLLLA